MFSKLTNSIAIADASNYTKGRNGHRICKITPHHVAGKVTGLQCARLFQNPNRNASANYSIGYNGDIVGCVDEENRAWTSNSRNNDYQAITIECSNDEIGGNWHISDKTWNSLVELCVDICTRYNFRLNYTGDASGSLTRHNMFQSTACPGPYLQSRFSELAEIVNKRLDGGIVPVKDYTYTQFVTELQATIGAKVDGIAGPETLSKTPTLSRYKNRTHRAVLPVQKYLHSLGYTEVGNADGIARS